MTRLPSERIPYNISNRTATEIQGKFRAYGSDWTELGENAVYFTSFPLERTVVFKAFFESIKINFQKEIDKLKGFYEYTIVKERVTQISYDITLNIPAHSVNESRNNLAKIEELQRLIIPGQWSYQKIGEENVLFGASKRYNMINPIMSVLFRNIINSGYPHAGSYANLSTEELLLLGFPCTIDSVSYSPELEAGYFEFDEYLFPKNYKLTLKLDLEYDPTYSTKINNKTIEHLDLYGSYAEKDTSLFPFHSFIECHKPSHKKDEEDTASSRAKSIYKDYFTMKEASDISPRIEKRMDSYVFIAIPAIRDNSQKNLNNYLLFKPMFVKQDRTVKTKLTKSNGANNSVFQRTMAGAALKDEVSYSLEFSVLSNNVYEARQNAAKIQYLSRLFLKKKTKGLETNKPSEDDLRMSEASYRKNLLFYVPGFIEAPNIAAPMLASSDLEVMKENSIDLYLENFNFEIDMELGFFEHGSKIFPKAYKISLGMLDTKNLMINNYFTDNPVSSEDVSIPVPDGSKMMTEDNSFLFPFNRKTVKIGGK